MRIVVTTHLGSGPRTWVVQAPDGATEGELLLRLGQPRPSGGAGEKLVHGYAVGSPGDGTGPAARSAGLPEGDLPQGHGSRSVGLARVVVEAGPDAGGSLTLAPGLWQTVGRDRGCDLVVDDPGLSRRHLRVRHGRRGFEVEDLGSTNGVHPLDEASGPPWAPGTRLLLGSTRVRLELEQTPPASGSDGDGRLVVRPWPRVVPAPASVELRTPARPARRQVGPPSVWAWALPLIAAGAAALLLRMPVLLVFGLLGPVMVVGQHLGDRRSARVEHAQALLEWESEKVDLETQRRRAVEQDRRVRWDRDPGVAGAVRALIPRPTTLLWCRAPETPTVVLGEGTEAAAVVVDARAEQVELAPVTLELTEPVVVVGRPVVRDAAVRAWIMQLVTSHPPGAFAITVDPQDPPEGWDLLAWLPHTLPHGATGPRRTLRWGLDLVLVEDVRDAPPGMVRVRIDGPTLGLLERPAEPGRPFRPTLLGQPLSRVLARRLAGLDDGSRAGAQRTRSTRLGDLVPWPTTPQEVGRTWQSRDVRLEVPVGTDGEGRPVTIDLDRDGPHALVAGTTGSGKSELLRSLVTGLAVLNPPHRLTLLLVDYKGGSSLGECARLPHSTGLVTDLDAHLADRVLTSLRAELVRREQVLADAGARGLEDYGGDELPRLVVVVDEFRVLAEEIPDFVTGLVRLAAVGRSLGLHLVLATQRPAGVVTPDLRANVNLRIALRVRDATDSQDVLDCPDAAAIPQDQPGLAILRTGAGPPRSLRVAPVGPPCRPPAGDGWAVHEVPDAWAAWQCLHADGRGVAASPALEELPDLLRMTADALGHRARTVWLPPLPERVTMESTGSEAPDDVGVPRPWALADRPDRQRREGLVWAGEHHLGLVGAARTGRTTALAALAAGVGSAWIYALDPGQGLSKTFVATDPRVRAWVGTGDRAHGLRVLDVLNTVVDDRRGVAAEQRSPVVVLLDGWDRWVEEYADLEGGRGVDLVLRLLREGPSARVVLAVTGDRSLLTGKVAAQLPELWAMRLHDPTDLALAGLSGARRPTHQPPGRAVRTSDGVVAQVVLPVPTRAGSLSGHGPEDPPPRVLPLPTQVPPDAGWAVGGDEARGVSVPGGSVLVLGPPRSGVSTTLSRLHDPPRSGPATDDDPSTLVVRPRSCSPGELARRLEAGPTTVVVDDAHLLAGTVVEDVVLDWATRTGGRLLVGGELEACANLYRGLVPHVARGGTGVVLQPTSRQHGALLGARLPLGDPRVPGRGVLVQRGRCTRVQVAGP